jgi:ankyrin repeat protein
LLLQQRRSVVLELVPHLHKAPQLQISRGLVLASRHGDIPLMRRLLALGASVASTWPLAVTLHQYDHHLATVRNLAIQLPLEPLPAAVASGNAAAVALLLQAGACPISGATPGLPLLLASQQGSCAILEQLMAAGAPPGRLFSATCAPHLTPLAAAAGQGHLEALTMLLQAGADVHACCGAALLAAVVSQQLPAARVLLAAGANPNVLNGTPLRLAATVSSYPLVAALLEHRAAVHLDADIALRVAARQGAFCVVGRLLEAGADPGAWGGQALVAAAAGGHTSVVGLLAAAGADPGAMQEAGLRAAAAAGHEDMVHLLLRGRHVPLPHLRPALLAAVQADQPGVVQALLQAVWAAGSQAVQAAAAAPIAAAAGASAGDMSSAAGSQEIDAAAAGCDTGHRTRGGGSDPQTARACGEAADEIWDVGQSSSRSGHGNSKRSRIIIHVDCTQQASGGRVTAGLPGYVQRTSTSTSTSTAAEWYTCPSGSASQCAGLHHQQEEIDKEQAHQEQQQEQQQASWYHAELQQALEWAVEHESLQVAALLLQRCTAGGAPLHGLLQRARASSSRQMVQLLQQAHSKGSGRWHWWVVPPLLGAASGLLMSLVL